MNKLPQEIIDHIVFFLPGGPDAEWTPQKKASRAQYDIISNKSHVAIERGALRRLRITSEELETFAQTLSPAVEVSCGSLATGSCFLRLIQPCLGASNDPLRLRP